MPTRLAISIRDERAAVATKAVLRHEVSTSTIRRLAKEVGLEIAEDDDVVESDKEIVVPEAAVVSCDGGRIRTRQAGGGRGVCLSGGNVAGVKRRTLRSNACV